MFVSKRQKSPGPHALGGAQMSALTCSSEIWGIGEPGELFCTAINGKENIRGSTNGGQTEAKLDKNNLSGNLSKHWPKWQTAVSILYLSSQLSSAPLFSFLSLQMDINEAIRRQAFVWSKEGLRREPASSGFAPFPHLWKSSARWRHHRGKLIIHSSKLAIISIWVFLSRWDGVSNNDAVGKEILGAAAEWQGVTGFLKWTDELVPVERLFLMYLIFPHIKARK